MKSVLYIENFEEKYFKINVKNYIICRFFHLAGKKNHFF